MIICCYLYESLFSRSAPDRTMGTSTVIACQRRRAAKLDAAHEAQETLQRLHRDRRNLDLLPHIPHPVSQKILNRSRGLSTLNHLDCPSLWPEASNSLNPEQHRQQHALLGKLPRRNSGSDSQQRVQNGPETAISLLPL